ncbi:MAG: class I SAM-dependent methyltransferase [Candidatus Dormibacteraeota bacterium]|uniref:Class I SAM-dependent methyltransferase n=1 Tax=Candidatus Amunia macphersoniae TaxID=3127014 RepID=A0A934NEK6_9BACT|nr:class I SAM-dependent methyltransferase [Candidatus Dormibacteraeota bacterium]
MGWGGSAAPNPRDAVPRLESSNGGLSSVAPSNHPTNEVRHADATHLAFDDASFDACGSFTMLHHVPTGTLQNRLLAKVLRVLRPGRVLIGSDSLPSTELHDFHEGDTYNPAEPGTLLARLQTPASNGSAAPELASVREPRQPRRLAWWLRLF